MSLTCGIIARILLIVAAAEEALASLGLPNPPVFSVWLQDDPFKNKALAFSNNTQELHTDPFQTEDPFRSDPFKGADPFRGSKCQWKELIQHKSWSL